MIEILCVAAIVIVFGLWMLVYHKRLKITITLEDEKSENSDEWIEFWQQIKRREEKK